MAGETSAVKQVHAFTDPLSASPMHQMNPDLYDPSMPRMYPIHRHIHIFSTARRDFPVSHVYFKGKLQGCHNGERYVKCYSVPDPPQQISIDAERGGKRVEVEPRDEAGWRVAIDILNPNNPSTNPYYQMDAKAAAYFSTGQNVDLIRYGLFPSLNEIPTEQELQKAEEARNKTYEKLVADAFEEQASNPQGFRVWLRNNPDIYEAAEALGVEADFLTKRAQIKQTCPNCGTSLNAGIAFHMFEGGLCVLDWKRAYEAGRVKKEDVPESKRWEGYEVKRGPGRPPNPV
jgi:hypothetical protein